MVTFEEAFTVQPFNNYVVSMTMTGAADLRPAGPAVVTGVNSRGAPKILQVSDGLHLHLHRSDAAGSTVVTDGRR